VARELSDKIDKKLQGKSIEIRNLEKNWKKKQRKFQKDSQNGEKVEKIAHKIKRQKKTDRH